MHPPALPRRSAGTAATSSAATAAPQVRRGLHRPVPEPPPAAPAAAHGQHCRGRPHLLLKCSICQAGQASALTFILSTPPQPLAPTNTPWCAAYHADCLGLVDAEVQAAKRWLCPQHACAICQRKAQVRRGRRGGCVQRAAWSCAGPSLPRPQAASAHVGVNRFPVPPAPQAVGGMLFRCEGCAHAYCEDHLPADADVVSAGAACADPFCLSVERLPTLGPVTAARPHACMQGLGCAGPQLKL